MLAAALLALVPVSADSRTKLHKACTAKSARHHTAPKARCAAARRSAVARTVASSVKFGPAVAGVVGRLDTAPVGAPVAAAPQPAPPAQEPASQPAPVDPPLLGTGRAVQVVGTEWSLHLSRAEVLSGSVRVEYNLTAAEDPHSLVLVREGSDGPLFRFPSQPAETVDSRRFDLTPGKWLLFCDLEGHAAKGMQTELTVR